MKDTQNKIFFIVTGIKLTFMFISLLFDEICKGKEEEQSDDISVNREDEFTNAHVEGSSRDDMETGIAELQGQHGAMELKFLRN